MTEQTPTEQIKCMDCNEYICECEEMEEPMEDIDDILNEGVTAPISMSSKSWRGPRNDR